MSPDPLALPNVTALCRSPHAPIMGFPLPKSGLVGSPHIQQGRLMGSDEGTGI